METTVEKNNKKVDILKNIEEEMENIRKLTDADRLEVVAIINHVKKSCDVRNVDVTSLIAAIKECLIDGLSFLKKHVYIVPIHRDNKVYIKMIPSYLSVIQKAYDKGVNNITPCIIYEGDEVEIEIERGIKKIVKHRTSLKNTFNQIIGVYVTFDYKGNTYTEIMNMNQVRMAWMLRGASGLSKAHKDFPDQMAIKTCLIRAFKFIVNIDIDDEEIEATIEKEVEGVDDIDEIDNNNNSEMVDLDEMFENTNNFAISNNETKVEEKVEEVKEDNTSTSPDPIDDLDEIFGPTEKEEEPFDPISHFQQTMAEIKSKRGRKSQDELPF